MLVPALIRRDSRECAHWSEVKLLSELYDDSSSIMIQHALGTHRSRSISIGTMSPEVFFGTI